MRPPIDNSFKNYTVTEHDDNGIYTSPEKPKPVAKTTDFVGEKDSSWIPADLLAIEQRLKLIKAYPSPTDISYLKSVDLLCYFDDGTKYDSGMLLFLIGLFNHYYDLCTSIMYQFDQSTQDRMTALHSDLGWGGTTRKGNSYSADTGASKYLIEGTHKGNLFSPIEFVFMGKVYTPEGYARDLRAQGKDKEASVWEDLSKNVSDRPGIEQDQLAAFVLFDAKPNERTGEYSEDEDIATLKKTIGALEDLYSGHEVVKLIMSQNCWRKVTAGHGKRVVGQSVFGYAVEFGEVPPQRNTGPDSIVMVVFDKGDEK